VGRRLVLCAVGDDEKTAVRTLLRVGPGSGDRVVLIYVEPAPRAVEVVRELVSAAGAELVESGIGQDPRGWFMGCLPAAAKPLRAAVEEGFSEVVGVVGGPIQLGLCVLIAVNIFNAYRLRRAGRRAYIYLPEAVFAAEFFRAPRLSDKEEGVLKVLARQGGRARLSELVSEASASLGVSVYHVYKLVYSLRAKGLVDFSDRTVVLTDAGRVFMEVLTHV